MTNHQISNLRAFGVLGLFVVSMVQNLGNFLILSPTLLMKILIKYRTTGSNRVWIRSLYWASNFKFF